ncbi:hypothetical protein ACFUAG_02325 [Streptomyces sp. NPDC057193]|uniref:hypothetical protein n=1 Tax=Streptomyces sp. NPDC057193 TaxID=3346043 RepID=UPI00362BF864
MSENIPGVTDLGATRGTEGGPLTPKLEGVPVAEVKPEDVATLSLEYRDGKPAIVVADGTAVPAQIPIVGTDGRLVGMYNGDGDPESAPAIQARYMSIGLHYNPPHYLNEFYEK